MTVREIIEVIEQNFPLAYQESYDNAGLNIGDSKMEVRGILLTIDVTEDVIDEAIARGTNLIISHHPLIFKGIKKLTGSNYIEKTIIKAITNKIAIYCAHTNLDVAWHGINMHVANKLGLTNSSILRPLQNQLFKIVTFVPSEQADIVRKALFEAGAGVIGNYDSCSFNLTGEGSFRGNELTNPFVGEPQKLHFEKEVRIETICPNHLLDEVISNLLKAHPYEEPAYDIYPLHNVFPRAGLGVIGDLPESTATIKFLTLIKEIFHCKLIRHTHLIKTEIRRVAFCGGSGSELLPDAIRKQADIFISADFKYHQFFDSNGKIIIADIGHFESEQFVKEIFYDILIKKFPNFAVCFSEVNTNPINYF